MGNYLYGFIPLYSKHVNRSNNDLREERPLKKKCSHSAIYRYCLIRSI